MDWQADACRDGVPIQREAMSEALEELLIVMWSVLGLRCCCY